jgi:hypothetical protein
MREAAALVATMCLVGCSFTIRTPDDPGHPVAHPIQCEDSDTTPRVDALGVLLFGALAGVVGYASYLEAQALSDNSSANVVGSSFFALAVVETIAAAHGFHAVEECRELKARYNGHLRPPPVRAPAPPAPPVPAVREPPGPLPTLADPFDSPSD